MSVTDLYRHLWAALEPGDLAGGGELEPPRGPAWFFELVDGVGLDPGARILDLACGPGEQAVALSDRYAAGVIAVDMVVCQLGPARVRAGGRPILICAGAMESVPLAAGSVHLVWLRDALMHSAEPERTLGECHRVLRAGGHMLLHTAHATDTLAPHELDLVEADMRVHRGSLDRARVDAAVAGAGFEVVRADELGGELAEHYELENGLGARALRRLALLNRRADAVRERLGEAKFRAAHGVYNWVVFQLLGKISYRALLLRKPA